MLLLAAVLTAGSTGAGVALAQTAATDQYGTDTPPGTPTTTTSTTSTTPTPAPVGGSGTTSTTPTTTTGGGTTTTPATGTGSSETPTTTTGTTTPATAGGGTTGGGTTGGGTTGGNGGNGGNGGTGATGSANGTAAAQAPTVHIIDFGRASAVLRSNIQAAIALTGLQREAVTKANAAAFKRFLSSPLMRSLSSAGVGAAGRAFGAQLASGSPIARQVYRRLFGAAAPFAPVTHAVLTRRVNLSSKEAQFLNGVARGLKSSGIPLAYVERTDAKKSFAKGFRNLKVLTVTDVDKALGQRRLARIMLGQVTSQKAVNALKTTRASQSLGSPDGSASGESWALVVLLVAAGGFVATGAVRHRSRTSARS
ncbi:hypothetical protein [Paraconexibacter sp. AEG42_29]